MNESAKKRVDLISKEFSEGFEFLENYPRSVTVFGSSQATEKDIYYQKALSLCKRIAGELKYSVITGGGPGIMEAANRGAFEAQGQSVGITIKLPREQATNSYITDKIALTYFFVRKVCLSFSAEAYIFFPGGFGTLDELFEILTLVQARKIEPVPLILVGSEYWRPLETFIRNELLDRKMIDPGDMTLFTIHDDENKILEIIKKVPVKNGVEYNHSV
ncbi:MAG: TIGR00730 family Rossman fold protein [Patescibacteria group bacterium]